MFVIVYLSMISFIDIAILFVQNGILSSIKPQQVTYVIPGIINYNHSRIDEFIKKAQDLLVRCVARIMICICTIDTCA
jgi:hypothetical protein